MTVVRKVLFIADDFGASDAVNAAVIHAHRRGRLHGAALMMGQPATASAVALARQYPTLEVGLHVHLLDSRPCAVPEWPWGASPARAGVALGFGAAARALARREIRAQWQAYQATGLRCRFVNAHHHLHVHPVVRHMLCEVLPADFGGWVRWGRPRFFGPPQPGHAAVYALLQAPWRRRLPFPSSTSLWGLDRTGAMDADEIRAVLPRLGPGLHEFMFHPRHLENDPDTTALLRL